MSNFKEFWIDYITSNYGTQVHRKKPSDFDNLVKHGYGIHVIEYAAITELQEKLKFAEAFILKNSGWTLDKWLENDKKFNGNIINNRLNLIQITRLV